jgi:hypothetical protein
VQCACCNISISSEATKEKIKELEECLEESREATHVQRIRALDLKYEMREVRSFLMQE